MELYNYQKKSLDDITNKPNKHIVIQDPGTGKTAVMMKWLYNTKKKKILIVTTASKRDSGDMERDAVMWNGEEWRNSLSSFEVIGWAALSKWAQQHLRDTVEYAIAFDEVAYVKHGIQSQRGKAFLNIAKRTTCWTGYTATPGDKWIDFQAYAIATGLVKNLTMFRGRFCNIQTFKGFPEIVSYKDTDKLQAWWDGITTRPDTSEMFSELPPIVGKVITLSTPKNYKKILKERKYVKDGKLELLDTNMGLCHWARQACATDDKRKQWLLDFIDNNPTQIIFFTNYKYEAEMVEEVFNKSDRKKLGRVWHIDGGHHEIPTEETMGKYDIVVANYQSGSEGLNLQFMNYCVFVSPNYSYSTSIQAKGRIRRVGQRKTQFYYYLKAEHTIEEAIYKTLKEKGEFSELTWKPDED